MRDRGAALLMAMISIMILLLISSIFFTLVTNNLRTETLEEKILKSYTLAEAGINYTFASVLNNIPTSGTPDTMTVEPPATQDLYTSEDPNANFTIQAVTLAWGIHGTDPNPELVSITVQCKGSYKDVDRILQEQYAIAH